MIAVRSGTNRLLNTAYIMAAVQRQRINASCNI